MPTWISEAQALLPVLIAGGVGYIGYQQFRIAKRKLQLDLYDKRWAIYDAMRSLLVVTWNSPDDLQSATLKAYEKKAEARFLLDEKACAYVERFVKTVTDYNNSERHFRSDRGGNSLTQEALSKQAGRVEWLSAQYEPLIEEFSRFLRIDHLL